MKPECKKCALIGSFQKESIRQNEVIKKQQNAILSLVKTPKLKVTKGVKEFDFDIYPN